MSLVINSYNYPYQGWRSVPSTGSQNSIRVSGNGQIQYFVSGTNGLYKSTDYGKTWNYVNFINYYIISFEISDSGEIIYLTTSDSGQGDYLFKSSDYGNTWQILNPPPIGANPYYQIINSSNDGNQIMLTTIATCDPPIIVKSIDGGASFTYTNTTGLPSICASWSIKSSRDFSVIYAKQFYTAQKTGPSELYKSIDYGANWVNCFTDINLVARRRVSTSRNGEFVIIHEELSQTVGNIIISTVISKDYGATWTPILGNSIFAAFSDDNKYITLTRPNNIIASTNGGLSFQFIKYNISGSISDISMSLDGRFQSLATNDLVWINNNFGY